MKRLLQQEFHNLYCNSDYESQNINVNEQLSSSERKLAEGSLYLQFTLISTIGFITLLPESVSNWDVDALKEESLPQKWKKNVKAGPVWDEDDFFINYVGHPVSGAWYYTMARNDGIDPFGSFLYSAFVSTFVWEYGYEAFAEIPSIQDLFSTPIIGSLMGEYFYYLETKIDANSGLVLNSKILGNISYFFLNPFGSMANGISSWLDMSVTMKFQTYQVNNSKENLQYNEIIQKPVEISHYDYGVTLNLEF